MCESSFTPMKIFPSPATLRFGALALGQQMGNTYNALERAYHCFYNGSDVIFSKKFLLKPLHYRLLPGLTPGFGVTFFFGLKYASFIGGNFAIIPAERGHPSSYLFNIIHHLFEGNHAASLPSVFGLLSLYLPNLRLCAIF